MFLKETDSANQKNTFQRCTFGIYDMMNLTLYVFRLPKAYKVNIWTLAWFNEANSPQISPELYSEEHLSGFVKALWCLLVGPLRTTEAQRATCACVHAQMYAHSYRPLSFSPTGNDDFHYRLNARWPQCSFSADLLGYQTGLLYWCSIVSFSLSFGVHQRYVALAGEGWKRGKGWCEKTQLVERIPSHRCWVLQLIVKQSLTAQTPLFINSLMVLWVMGTGMCQAFIM